MHKEHGVLRTAKLISIFTAFVFFAFASACDRRYEQTVVEITGGTPDRGRDAIRAHGCATCHTIPGIRGADGLVGPSLERIASRVYLAGRIQNTPSNMIHWVRFPKQVDPETAMPQMEISEQEGRDITAYLYTLR
jgi:cytochrome c